MNITIDIRLSVLNSGILQVEVVLGLLVEFLQFTRVVIPFLVVSESLIIHNLVTNICVTVVLADWDSHGWHFVLIMLLGGTYIPASNR